MELHHKLRRDPNWHPSACNICGQLGHQAVNCTNGTINWRQIYGDEAFRLKQPLYESDLLRMRKDKAVDVEAWEKRANEYAQMRANAAGVDYDGLTKRAQGMAADAEAAAGVPAIKPDKAAESEKPPLPPGWAIAKDAQNREYYWHTKTKKVTWDRPTADTPIE